MTDDRAKNTEKRVEEFRAAFARTRAEIERRIVGQGTLVDDVLTCLVAGGHVLLEGVPGLGKTMLVRTLAEGGYLRVPMVEDPGTFSVRGSIIDIYPPNARHPARIELDDYLVLSIKHFDPEDQKTIASSREIALHPVREALLGLSEIALARTKVRDLCDELEIPTRQAKQLLEDLESGRMVLGIEGLLPAFYEGLATLADYLPAGHRVAILDPTAVGKSIEEELAGAEADHAAKTAHKGPCFPVRELYADAAEMVAPLAAWRKARDDDDAGPPATRTGWFRLLARDATVAGEKLCYEPPPEKDPLGYWVNAADRAWWDFRLDEHHVKGLFEGGGSKPQGGHGREP